jgi:hypothetical protein
VTIDKFLSFWSQYNTLIIEGLVALIILLSLFVGDRGFFGKKDAGSSDAGGGLDAVQLEKTLQRILDNQGKTNAATHADSATEHADIDHSHGKPAASGGSAESAAEVAQLKAAVAEGRKKAEALQVKVKEAEEKAAAAIANAGAGGAAAPTDGMSEQEKEDYAAKIRDLEARLAEYEIISEDIADLSRYREENDELRKELDNVKSNQAATPVAAAPVQAAPQAAAPEPPPPAEAAPPAPELEVPIAEAAPAAEESPNADLIDDELMREFAAAVEGQQSKTKEKVVQKAGDGSTEAKDTGDDATKLMSEFENFVAKKS